MIVEAVALKLERNANFEKVNVNKITTCVVSNVFVKEVFRSMVIFQCGFISMVINKKIPEIFPEGVIFLQNTDGITNI